MTGFSADRRSAAAELMDDDAVDFATFESCLADLARVNRLSLGYRPTLRFLEGLRLAGRLRNRGLIRIVDAGSGYGDTLREIALWARRHEVPVALAGVDRNPHAARAAAAATPADTPVVWRTEDIFDYRPERTVDIVISALFTHHLDDAALVRFVGWMEATARIGWFVNDLRRSRLACHGFAVASAALRMHRFVRHDGPVSFARSFVEADWRKTLAAAKIPEGTAAVGRRAPFRLCVTRVKAP